MNVNKLSLFAAIFFLFSISFTIQAMVGKPRIPSFPSQPSDTCNPEACLNDWRDYIVKGDSTQLQHCISNLNPPLQFNWIPNTGLSNAQIEKPMASPQAYTNYILTITDADGCQAQSNHRVYVYGLNKEEEARLPVHIYPQPATHYAQIEFPGQGSKLIHVYTDTGRTMHKVKTADNELRLDVKSWGTGIYILEIRTDQKVIRRKLIVQN